MKFLLLSLYFASAVPQGNTDSSSSTEITKKIIAKAAIRTESNPNHANAHLIRRSADNDDWNRNVYHQDPCRLNDFRCICPDGRPSNGQGCFGGDGMPFPGRLPDTEHCFTKYFDRFGRCCSAGELSQCCDINGKPWFGDRCPFDGINGIPFPTPYPRDCFTKYFDRFGRCCSAGELTQCCDINGKPWFGDRCPYS